jgi:hypothetical protein
MGFIASSEAMPPGPCGSLTGSAFYFLVPQTDADKMSKLGYKISHYS